jgi:hypothetical protein
MRYALRQSPLVAAKPPLRLSVYPFLSQNGTNVIRALPQPEQNIGHVFQKHLKDLQSLFNPLPRKFARRETYYKAPTAVNILSNSPLSFSFTSPPVGPSLHPPINLPSIQMAGTDVRPTMSPNSARIALPSGSFNKSTSVYFVPFASRISLALTQKGQVSKESMRTGLSRISPSRRSRTATLS